MDLPPRGVTVSVWTWAIALIALVCSSPVRAQDSSDCLVCHGEQDFFVDRDGQQVSMWFDEEAFGKSVHASADCIDCHGDLDGVEDFPHERRLEPATCDMCHDDSFESIEAYMTSTHGKELEAGNPNAPRCADCHGGHDILKSIDPASSTFVLNVPWTCAKCHADGEPIERHDDLTRKQVVERYKDTIHGAGLFERGLKVAPVCTTCHAAHGVLPYTDPASMIHKDRVNDSCTQCHYGRQEIHRGIIDAEAWAQAGMVPICVDCHQPHGERRVAYGTNMSDGECLACHANTEIVEETGRASLLVDSSELAHSVHGRQLVACAQCHTGAVPAEDFSCHDTPRKVNCGVCHDTEVAEHERGIHGSLHAEGDEDAPGCADCHGRHGIVESALPANRDVPAAVREAILASPTHRRNVPDLCARCHRDGAEVAARNPDSDVHKVDHYLQSIHGKGLLESGLIVSANCVDCHSAHMELPASDPDSTVAPENIVATCGKCHDGIDEHFRQSAHSSEGNPDFEPTADGPGLPHCNDCHSSHSVARTDMPEFKQGIVEQCGKCHAEITETYFHTYHGKVTALGGELAARCHDCHGAHEIHRMDGPGSLLDTDEKIAVCGKCHDGAHASFVQYRSHGTHKDPDRYPWLYWSFLAMTWLLVGVFSFFGLHLLAWLPRSVALRRELQAQHKAAGVAGEATGEAKEYQRFNWINRTLHRMVIVSFLALALTGMSLKFSQTGWAKVLISVMGGTETAGWIHRIGAVITFAYFGIHLVDLMWRFAKSGKSAYRFFLGPDSMVPSLRDVQDFVGTMNWFFGLGPRPRYGKWTYWEKFDYFAVFWGVLIIGTSGLIMWFPVIATHLLPGWAVNVATIIHSEEALLASGFIFSIHFFNTHLRPEKFPMDKVVFTGSMPIEELKADKPELYERLVASGELEKFLVDAPNPRQRRRVYIFGFIALAIGVTLLVLLVHGLLTVGL